MKVYLNRKPVVGPWGGGNKTLSLLSKSLLEEEGIDLVYDLSHRDIDIIFCIDPKPDNTGIWHQNFLDYKSNINNNVKIIQRVGDLGTHRGQEITKLVHQTINMSDFLIFPSDWARKAIGFKKSNYVIIQNSPMKIFYTNRTKQKKINRENIKVVTHHWSDNPKKGFQTYQEFGSLIKDKKNISFTYIGRYNQNYSSEGIEIIEPKNADELSQILPNFDIYLTASELEAGANHVLEGLAAGLPVLYKTNGGSIEEYCFNYGFEYYDTDSLYEALKNCISNYKFIVDKAYDYNDILSNQIKDYLDVIKHVYSGEKYDTKMEV